ncbi:phage/plasmid primase, P4 family, partial [Kocuria oceani]
ILPDRGGQPSAGDLRDVFTPGTTASATTAASSITAPAGTPATADLHEGETRMAYRLATAYQDRLMHVHGFGWFAWDGRRWEEDKVGHARRALIDVLAQDLRAALEDRDRDRVNALRKIERDAAQRGVLKIAEDLPAFARTIDDLDADPWLLNTANGTLDLRTMALRPHDPADRITKVTRGAYRPEDLDGSRWARFLSSTLPDSDVRAFLARYVGQALTGRVLEHKLAILTGTGRNGKGTFYGALGFALGEYATVVEPDLLLHRDGAHPTGEMDLRGVRWAVVSETDEGRKLAMSTVKRLTGGDRIRARRMRQDFVEFNASHTLALITNHLPRVDGDDPAIWARLRVIPFDQKFDTGGRRPVKDLPEQLEADADAVLSWTVAGWEDYRHRDGLDEPAAIVAATENYHAGADHVGRFLDVRGHDVTSTGRDA